MYSNILQVYLPYYYYVLVSYFYDYDKSYQIKVLIRIYISNSITEDKCKYLFSHR